MSDRVINKWDHDLKPFSFPYDFRSCEQLRKSLLILKESELVQVYFFDNGDIIGDEGSRFENLIATSLLKSHNLLIIHDDLANQIIYDNRAIEIGYRWLRTIFMHNKCFPVIGIKLLCILP